MLLIASPPLSDAQEPDSTTEIPHIKTAPLPGKNLRVFENFGRLMRDPAARGRMLKALRTRVLPLRATYIPKPPFDPRFPKHVHGVAYIAYLPVENAATRIVWQTPSSLVRDATYVSLRDATGGWHRVDVHIPCKEALMARITGIPEGMVPGRADRAGPITQTGLTIAKKSALEPGIPILGVRNIESAFPILGTANLGQPEKLPVQDAWEITAEFPNGTPLISARGEVLLVMVKQGLARFAVFPPSGFICPAATEPNATKQPSP